MTQTTLQISITTAHQIKDYLDGKDWTLTTVIRHVLGLSYPNCVRALRLMQTAGLIEGRFKLGNMNRKEWRITP